MSISPRFTRSFEQIYFLFYEIRKANNRKWWRWCTCWFTSVVWLIGSYRIGRASYLLFGDFHVVLRFVLSPVLFLLGPWTVRHGIHYRAQIGRGLSVLHPELGVVVSGDAVVGRNLVLTGGNCIGIRRTVRAGEFVIGNGVNLGANAVILGPVHVGNRVKIGAGAVVVHDVADSQVVVGVPARPLDKSVGLAGQPLEPYGREVE
jgi:serine acetyltransferase